MNWIAGELGLRLVMADGIVDRMVAERAAAGRKETGGILVGRYLEDRSSAVIEDIRGTRKSRGWFARFRRGVGSLQHYLDEQWDGYRRYYIGEWHSHPAGPPLPSSQDDRQMLEIGADKAYRCPEPILVIVADGPSIGAYLYVANERTTFVPQAGISTFLMQESQEAHDDP